MGDVGHPGTLTFPLLITFDQDYAQYVSWKIIPLVAH